MLHEKNGIVYPPASQQNNKKSEVCIKQQERAGVSRFGQEAGGGILRNKTLSVRMSCIVLWAKQKGRSICSGPSQI